jgi:hypothetical protein
MGYDPRQALDFIANLGAAVQRDAHVGIGFLGERRRIEQRNATSSAAVAKLAKRANESSFRDTKYCPSCSGTTVYSPIIPTCMN